jgi:hypothetical protein
MIAIDEVWQNQCHPKRCECDDPCPSQSTRSTPRISRPCAQPFGRSATRCCSSATAMTVTKIVALAEAGEHDAQRLTELVLNDLADDGLAAAE